MDEEKVKPGGAPLDSSRWFQKLRARYDVSWSVHTIQRLLCRNFLGRGEAYDCSDDLKALFVLHFETPATAVSFFALRRQRAFALQVDMLDSFDHSATSLFLHNNEIVARKELKLPGYYG